MKRCVVFRYLSKDSLLVSVLSYNVGIYRLLGYGRIPKSKLIRKLEQGDRDIYEEYISFRMCRGEVIPSLERRRKEEFKLLFKLWKESESHKGKIAFMALYCFQVARHLIIGGPEQFVFPAFFPYRVTNILQIFQGEFRNRHIIVTGGNGKFVFWDVDLI